MNLKTFAEERNVFTGNFPEQAIGEVILPIDEWRPFPKMQDRASWSGIPENIRVAYINKGEALLDYSWPNLPASVFMEFAVNGNRSNFEKLSFERRNNLTSLVLAEMLEGEGRFLDNIVNGIWAICEETYWGIPAHLYMQKSGNGLPDVSEPTVDLFAAETGALLAWIVYLLENELDTISPLICDRVRLETDRRILTPCLERNDFWWQGLLSLDEANVKLERLNNWAPWIDSNWLTTVLLLEQDADRRQRAVYKIMRCLDQYLNPYPADGGCDEGPSYWSHAGGRVFHALELLESASSGKINLYGEPLIQEMGKYIYRAHIERNYYINFADASAVIRIDPSLVFRYGRSIGDPQMTELAAYAAKLQDYGNASIGGSLAKQLFGLFTLKDLQAVTPSAPALMDVWLQDIQVMAARSAPGSQREFYMAAKGGHNNESHNHNDVGNFIVYLEGHPVIIDIGVETYSKKTFSAESRYEIWTMQSAYHSLPTINGYMQVAGQDYKARDVQYVADEESSTLSLDISAAYPVEARIESYERTIVLKRGKSVQLTDTYSLFEYMKPLSMSPMTPLEVELGAKDRIRLFDPSGQIADVFIDFDPDKFTVQAEPIPIEDKRLQPAWGHKLTRIILTSRDEKVKDTFTLRIH